MNKNMSLKKKLVIGLAVVVLFAGGFYAGLRYGINTSLPQAEAVTPLQADFSLFWDVVETLKKNHIDGGKIDDMKILDGAIKGAVETLGDPYTTYFSAEDAKKFNEDLTGVFGGIGAEIGIRDNQLLIISPLKGNPAEKVGLKANDKIMEINGTSTMAMNIDEAIKLIRGEPGTTVTLLIMREEWKESKEIKIERAVVNVPTLDWEMKPGNIAYFKLYNFNANLTSAWNTAATQALLQRPNGIIIDLRNNPGGFLDISTQITGWFVKRGDVIVRERFRGGEEEYLVSSGNEAMLRIPVVVLVNEGSASASEIVAGALRDLRGAKIVGVKTFGKGSVQEVESLRHGSTIKVSIAEWLTPSGKSINKVGITPDVEVKMTEADYEKKLDPQFNKAVEILLGEINSSRR